MKQLFETLLLLLFSMMSFAQGRTITGCVILENDGPLPGASVRLVKDTLEFKSGAEESPYTRISTSTDIDGRFTLTIPEAYAGAAKYIGVSFMGGISEVFLIKESDSFSTTVKIDRDKDLDEVLIMKPAIYLYPAQPIEIMVVHDFKGTIGTTYPDYGAGWKVRAQPDGTLLNLKDNRKYEYLFWDGTYRFPPEHAAVQEGFVVKKEETTRFLREKLELVGLNNKEINDFIVYWLPALNQHACNLIHFRINDDIDHSSILHVTPEPDSRIRLYMEYRPVAPGFKIMEQVLQPYPRKGFTLVEWGGAKMESPVHIR